jgi:hypothetical protein
MGFFASIALSSCDKVDDLLDPKSGDDIVGELMPGVWRLDTLRIRNYEQALYTSGSILANRGTMQFDPVSKELGSNYLVGQRIERYADTSGTAIADSGWWYVGSYGSTSLNSNRTTFFYRLPGGSPRVFDSRSANILDFKTREQNRVILEGGSGYSQGGITVRTEVRYVLSR